MQKQFFNFIDEENFRRDKNIAITDFAYEFLMLHYSDVKHLIVKFKELEQKLISFGQQLLISKSNDNLDAKSIHYQSRSELVAAMQLLSALNSYKIEKDNAFEKIKYAQELVPLYYENNLALARIYGVSSPLKATAEYEQAIMFCRSSEEKVRVYVQHADFLVRMNDYQKAVEIITKAEELEINSVEVKIVKAKILGYIGKYESAEEILNSIDLEVLSNGKKNMVQTRRADIYRRRSELIDIRETQKRLLELKKAYSCLEKCDAPDLKVFEYMGKILDNLSYMCMDSDALEFILEIVEKHYQDIKKTKHYKSFRNQMTLKLELIQDLNFKKKISPYIIDYNLYLDLLKSDEAVIYSLKEGYGFCKNSQYPQGIYFSKNGLNQDINYGDILRFSSILDSKGRLSLVLPKKVDSIEDRIIKL